MTLWKTPDIKPDVFRSHRILVIYEAHDEPELMLSTEYVAFTADRYVNRWCYWDEFIAQADKAERLQKAVDLAVDYLEQVATHAKSEEDNFAAQVIKRKIDEIKQLTQGE